ncbi:DUF3426 domain-containing protein [Luteimonas sp. MJ204]|uniref:DUF3426 domain-containing protein n=1 Tax=Luteimonas sp. MJ145 TaxID=3129234 RepID=UPI0031BA91E8
MFVNCPSCRGLVATDPASDLPPERCPRCAAPLRDLPGGAVAPVGDARSGVAAAISEAFDGPATSAGNPADDGAAQPAISLATLLQVPVTTPMPHPPAVAHDGPPEAAPDGAAEGTAVHMPGDGSGAANEEGDEAPLASTAPAEAHEPADTSGPGLEPAPAPTPTPAAEAETEAEAKAEAEAAPASGPRETTPAPAPRRATGRAAPSFARTRRTAIPEARPGRAWALPAAIVALALLLLLQWLLADRARLAADPAWRPVVARACELLRCSLPPWREPAAFVLLERDVRPHPQAANALRIAASFRNDAAWPQPWPGIVLTLSDIDGRPLGTRAFTAAEYLGGEPPSELLGSGQGAMIRMDVLEPGPGAVGFAFDFHDGAGPMAAAPGAR